MRRRIPTERSTPMDNKKYIGMDVHQATITVAVRDSAGKLVMESILETKASTILEFIRGLGGNLSVTFEDAKRRPRPFDRILIDDTSRLARNVADALNMVATLRFHGVGVTFVSQGID